MCTLTAVLNDGVSYVRYLTVLYDVTMQCDIGGAATNLAPLQICISERARHITRLLAFILS